MTYEECKVGMKVKINNINTLKDVSVICDIDDISELQDKVYTIQRIENRNLRFPIIINQETCPAFKPEELDPYDDNKPNNLLDWIERR